MPTPEEPDSRPASHQLTSFSDTLRSEGLGWMLRRLRYRTPHTELGRRIHAGIRMLLGKALYPKRRWLQSLANERFLDRQTLYAFYDLQVAPVTFDASWFAVAADRQRQQLGLSRTHFIIVPGNFNGFREERAHYEASIDTETRLWRLHHVVLPIFTLAPGFSGFSILPTRKAAKKFLEGENPHIYPQYFEPGFPVSHHPSEVLKTIHAQDASPVTLQSTIQGRRYVSRWIETRLKNRRLIAITLRDYEFMQERNSNLSAWTTFAQRLDPTRFLPVFIPDTESTLDLLPKILEGFEVFREASWNVPLRMALYELSYLNLGVNNGPMFMCALNRRTRLLIFKLITASVPQTTQELIASLGFEIGGQLPFATPFQKLVWEEDTLPVIEREFHALVAAIENEPVGD